MNDIRTRSIALAATLAVTLVASVTACSSHDDSPEKQFNAAKQATLLTETQIAATAPAYAVLSTHQTLTSKVIFPCLKAPNHSYWPGSTQVNLRAGTDTNAIMAAIGVRWDREKGWTIVRREDAAGQVFVVLTSSTGAKFTVTAVRGPQLIITAYSSCFPSSGFSGRKLY